MKTTFLTLTLLVAAITIAPRQSYGQYAWVPVYTDDDAKEEANEEPGQTGYATFVGEDTGDDEDLLDFDGAKSEGDDGKGKGGSCKTNCGCPSCKNSDILSRSFVGIEYLQWWTQSRTLPPLVSRGPIPANATLFGGDRIGGNLQAGARITGGFWLDNCETSALVLRAFGSEGESTSYSIASPGSGTFGVPFTNPPATPAFLTVSNGAGDSISATSTNDIIGGDLYYKTLLNSGSDYRFDLLAGFQYSRIEDDLDLRVNSPNAPVLGNFRDTFDATNDFAAGEFGLLGEMYQGPVTIQVMGKLGLGNMRQKVAIAGSRTTPGAVGNGVFAHSGLNSGTWERNRFAWSPEISIKGVWHLRDNVSMTVGYSFLYWNNVVLAGDQVNTSVPAALIAGTPAAGPATFAFRDTDFWVQTIDIGLAVRY